jgi:hypothetical protein
MLKKMIMIAVLIAAMVFVWIGPAGAKNYSTCDFQQGTTTCTDVHGSDGSFDTHHGQVNSSGQDTGGGDCKVTGPTHSC